MSYTNWFRDTKRWDAAVFRRASIIKRRCSTRRVLHTTDRQMNQLFPLWNISLYAWNQQHLPSDGNRSNQSCGNRGTTSLLFIPTASNAVRLLECSEYVPKKLNIEIMFTVMHQYALFHLDEIVVFFSKSPEEPIKCIRKKLTLTRDTVKILKSINHKRFTDTIEYLSHVIYLRRHEIKPHMTEEISKLKISTFVK